MERLNECRSDLSERARSKTSAVANEHSQDWQGLCNVYLPFESDGTIWRYSRESKPGEPTQGWKIHISVTVLQACDLFEKVAAFLVSKNLRFKAPASLRELIKINSGLDYGYWQVGKFLTVYPSTENEAVEIARKLHELTSEFVSIAVPFDKQYLPTSSVFYRYGAFEEIKMKNEDGSTLPAVRNSSGELVHDDHFQAVPEWLNDPFQAASEISDDNSESAETPLMTTYRVFRAITQRGKGGTYQALDLSTNPPRFCIVKEGRRHGEFFWNGQDGYSLTTNEKNVLERLGRYCKDIPKYFSAFEAFGNFYLVMEYIEGKSLYDWMKFRQRRFSIKQVIIYAIEIAQIVENIHKAGWIWNDCKPSNLIVTATKSLRPIDFEGAYPINQAAPFNWRSHAFSRPAENQTSSANDDYFALGTVIYFLLAGSYYDPNVPISIDKLRRHVPEQLKTLITILLNNTATNTKVSASGIRKQLKELLDSC